jgi:hypothetical protein
VCVCKSVVRVFWGFTPFLFLIQKYADLLRIQEKKKQAYSFYIMSSYNITLKA